MSEDNHYMRLVTKTVVEEFEGGEKVEWVIRVLSPMSTAKLLTLIPEGSFGSQEEDIDLASIIREHYLEVARDVVYPSIVKPKIDVEVLSPKTVLLLFPELIAMSFPQADIGGGEGGDGFHG